MNPESYLVLSKKHLSECEKYGISLEDAVFEIMHMAEDYSDEEVISTFGSLTIEIIDLVHKKLNVFEQSGEYHIISSTGMDKDVSNLMARLSKLIE